MTPADRRAAALDSAWDAVVRGEPVLPPDGDAEAAALLARLRATTIVPTLFPEPERSWRELRAGAARRPPASPSDALPRSIEPAPNGWLYPAGSQRPSPLPDSSRRRWLLNQMATAALLVLALGAGFLVLWQNGGRERDAESWLPDTAIASIPGYKEDVLFEATFAAAELPASPAAVVFYRATLPTGTALQRPAATSCLRAGCINGDVVRAVGVELVEAGAYDVRLDAPIWVQRADDRATKFAVEPGQDAALRPGDVAVFHDYASSGELRNPGAAPTNLLGMAVINYTDADGEPMPLLPPEIRGEQLDISLTTDWEALPDGPVKVILRRVTLPAATLLPPFEPRGLESIRVERGAIAWTFAQSGEAAEHGLRIHRRAGETAPFAITRNGAFRFLESTADEPAELLVLTVEPAGANGNPLSP